MAADRASHSGMLGMAAAEVTGDAAQQDAQHKADGGGYEGDGQGHPAAVQEAGEDVAPHAVRAEDVDAGLHVGYALFVHQAVQVAVTGNEAKDLILRALGEEIHIILFGGILGSDNRIGLSIVDLLELVDVRTGKAAVLVPPVNLGGSGILVQAGEVLQSIRGQEVRKQRAKIQDGQHDHAELGQLVFFQLEPHQLPLGSHVAGFVILELLFLQNSHGLNSFPRTGSEDPARPGQYR